MNSTLKVVPNRSYTDDPSDGNSLDAKLLRIYWQKKELDDFLPTIATYSSSAEVAAIALAQLQNIEREIVEALKQLGETDC